MLAPPRAAPTSTETLLGICDEELGRLLRDAGAPVDDVPRALTNLAAWWQTERGTVDALLDDASALEAWGLAPGTVALLRSVRARASRSFAADSRPRRRRDPVESRLGRTRRRSAGEDRDDAAGIVATRVPGRSGRWAAGPGRRGIASPGSSRGATATPWISRGDESRRRRDVATRISRGDESRPRRGYPAETSRGDAAAATWELGLDRRAPQVL